MFTCRLNVLVILVILAVASFAPKSGNAQTDIFQYGQKRPTVSVRRYCGANLSNVLQFICHGVYNSMFKKSGQGMEMDDYHFPYDESTDPYPLKSRERANTMMGRFRREPRGVYEECCIKPCSTQELSTYCGSR